MSSFLRLLLWSTLLACACARYGLLLVSDWPRRTITNVWQLSEQWLYKRLPAERYDAEFPLFRGDLSENVLVVLPVFFFWPAATSLPSLIERCTRECGGFT